MGKMEGDADIGMLTTEIQQGWKQIEGGVVRDGKVWSHTEEYNNKKKQEKDGELEAGCRMKRWGGADWSLELKKFLVELSAPHNRGEGG